MCLEWLSGHMFSSSNFQGHLNSSYAYFPIEKIVIYGCSENYAVKVHSLKVEDIIIFKENLITRML